MSTKPRILAKTKRIINLEKRKTPLTLSEQQELLEFQAARLLRDRERVEWDAEQERVALERKRQAELERKRIFLARCEHAHDMICGKIGKNLEDKTIIGRDFGVLIREIRPYIHLDWQSKAYLDAVEEAKRQGNPKPNPTKEHIYPMQFSGEFVLTHIEVRQELSLPQFISYATVFSQVADVLRHENHRLGSGKQAPQKADRFLTPEHAYREASIEVDFTPIMRLEDIAPKPVLEAHFGDRLEKIYKYNS